MNSYQWDNETRSDTNFEKQRNQVSRDARKRSTEDPDEKSRMIPHPDFELRVPRTDASLSLNSAKKKPKS